MANRSVLINSCETRENNVNYFGKSAFYKKQTNTEREKEADRQTDIFFPVACTKTEESL